jgi:hypothetical protein
MRSGTHANVGLRTPATGTRACSHSRGHGRSGGWEAARAGEALRRVLLTLALALGMGTGAASGGVLVGCTAPTIPLPPPAALVVEGPDASGFVVVRGTVLARAYVGVLNTRLERGVLVRADASGRFEARLEAEAGDILQVWQLQNGDRGPLVELCVACSGATDR